MRVQQPLFNCKIQNMFPFSLVNCKRVVLVCCVVLLCSCASYHQRIQDYHTSIRRAEYKKANKQLDKIPLLKKDRNRLLYVLEKGKTLHLMQQYDSSNKYLQEADLLMEISRNSVKDMLVTGLLNPMYRQYQPEDFEKFMVHYYKTLNFLFLGNTAAALVEARRISLQNNLLDDKFKSNKHRYSSDAFSLMLQGIIYEKGNDLNNAFIAYRNAADVYLQNGENWYGTDMPLQLKKDVLRTAASLGFLAELQQYETKFGMKYTAATLPAGGEAVIFWEMGVAPVKQQELFEFTLYKKGDGYFFRDRGGMYDVPFDNSVNAFSTHAFKDMQVFAIALPKYIASPLPYQQGNILAGNGSYSFEKAQDINVLAVQTLRERYLKELATALSRMAIKKITEAAVEPDSDKDKKYNTEEEKQKAERQADRQRVLAMGLKLFNRISEQADTRNWQSLPANIYYSRIPLLPGTNECNISFQNESGALEKKSLLLQGRAGLQFQTVYSTN